MSSDHIVLLHLSLIDGVGPIAVQKIRAGIQSLSIAWTDLYGFCASDLSNYFGFSVEQGAKIVAGLADIVVLERELALIEKHAISWTTVLSDTYPSLLKEIHVPPTVLYFIGASLHADLNTIAFVGSRKANNYAQEMIGHLVKPLAGSGWTIVSGGAVGADSMAHQATLEVSGRTIAVFGSGLLKPYPACNKKLFDRISCSGGTVISSFPLTVDALAGNFPARNRIISGLSRGCVVVQAAERSGASITAGYALEQGREVFAVPGAVTDPLSAGCHRLIGQGARLVTNVQDILQEFGCRLNYEYDEFKEPENVTVDPIEAAILRICVQAISIDELIQKVQLPLDQAQTRLFELQLGGKIRQNFMGMWECI